jgi:hypothetical protein
MLRVRLLRCVGYSFRCSCGVSGKPRDTFVQARAEGRYHRAIADDAPGGVAAQERHVTTSTL